MVWDKVVCEHPDWSLIFMCAPFYGYVWSFACSGKLRFRFVRLVQALLSSPPPLVLFRVRRPRLFFSLALSGSARSGLGVLVVGSSPSLFFCGPLLGSRLNICHLIFSFISFPFPSSSSFSCHCPGLNFSPSCGRVCVRVPSEKM